MRNLHSTYSQKLGGDFAKFCDLLRIYELYVSESKRTLENFTINGIDYKEKKNQIVLLSRYKAPI